MWGAAESLSAQSAHALANDFATLPPRPAGDGDTELVATGRTIYQQGMPEDNIVACVVCHGPNAEGVGEIPRLGGLAFTYLQRTLAQWGQGYHLNSGPPMPISPANCHRTRLRRWRHSQLHQASGGAGAAAMPMRSSA